MKCDLLRFQNLAKEKKQVVYLYLCTIASVGLGVLSSVVNTRYMSPSAYGDVRYIQNILNLLSSLLLFGYFQSGSRLLALAKDYQSCRRIKGVMIIILMLCSLALIVGTLICYYLHLEKPHIAVLFLVSLPVCCNQLYSNYINNTAQGDNQIGRLALNRVLPGILYAPLAYWLFSQTGASSTKMILLQWGLGTLIGLCIIISTKPSFRYLKPVFAELRKENKDYGIHLYIGSLVMVSTNYLAGITLGWMSIDNSEVGFYTLALTVTTPLVMLPSIIGTTYFKKFATQSRIPDKVMKGTVLITLASCILFILFIKYLVLILYTDRYAPVANYASWLAIGFSVHGIGDMINRYLGSHGQGVAIRNSSIANGVFKLFGYTVLVYFLHAPGAVLTTVLCSVIYFVVLLYYYKKFIATENGK